MVITGGCRLRRSTAASPCSWAPDDDNPDTFSEEGASFISMDPPRHDDQRRAVSPIFSTPALIELEPLIRSRAVEILDELPIGETFDFVDRVSIELTSQMLATLFDFPFEQRRLLPRFSDMILSGPAATAEEQAQRQAELFAILGQFVPLWNARGGVQRGAGPDFACWPTIRPPTAATTRSAISPTSSCLIVAGSDTTRHSITGGLLALNQHPAEYDKLRKNPGLLESAVPEIIRWQSPVAYMRRTALDDVEFGGKTIR